jgi:methionyl-tRNA synthetase
MIKRHLVTAALPYANGAQHLGHLAGNFLPADCYVRFLRLLGEEVVWVCGSDEHGAAITLRSKTEGLTPQQIVDKYHFQNKETFARLGLSFDIYHRTSLPVHHQTAQEFFTELYEKGDEFEERTNEQYYDEEYKQFLADRYITGQCPKCGHPNAYGDQCEKCGSALSPLELIDPKSTLSGKPPVLRQTKHWYFKLDKHADWLRAWIEQGTLDGKQHHDPKDWRKHVIGQCVSWLDGGLQPRAITRDLDWGVKVPLPDAEGKVLYVWFDAPIGYISATKDWAAEQGKDWRDYWQSEDCQLVHFLGKDNIVFHCLIFPAMLKAQGSYNLPVNVPANQFLNFEGEKFSKSRGWGITLEEYLENFKEFPNHVDALRYTLIRNMPENRDSDFKWDEFVELYDKELADKLGNFVNRVTVLTNKYYDGQVPSFNGYSEAMRPVHEMAIGITEELWHFNFKNAIGLFMELATYGNTYLQDVSPWKIWKDDPDSAEVAECLRVCLDIVSVLGVLAQPFIPFTSARIGQLLRMPPLQAGDWKRMLDVLESRDWLLEGGHQIGASEILFAKIMDRNDGSRLAIVEREKAKLQAILDAEKAEKTPELSPVKAAIQFEDFQKLDIRTGTILEAERHPKADKLLVLKVDIGLEKRTVVSGIAEHYAPEAIVGRRVLLLANLAPRKLRGIESQGMILMSADAAGKLFFVAPQGDIGNGFGVS